MKIQKIALRKHFFFGDIDIDLMNSSGKPLDTVVFAGNNGCGKTTLLIAILDILTGIKTNGSNSGVDLSLQTLTGKGLVKEHIWKQIVETNFNAAKSNLQDEFDKGLKEDEAKKQQLPENK